MSQGFHHHEQLLLQEDIADALSHLIEGVATPEEIKLVIWATGVQLKKAHVGHRPAGEVRV